MTKEKDLVKVVFNVEQFLEEAKKIPPKSVIVWYDGYIPPFFKKELLGSEKDSFEGEESKSLDSFDPNDPNEESKSQVYKTLPNDPNDSNSTKEDVCALVILIELVALIVCPILAYRIGRTRVKK